MKETMKYRITIIMVLMLCFPLVGQAQSPDITRDTITWTASGDKNLITGDSFTRALTFVSYGDSAVAMVNGDNIRYFNVTSVEGTWTDIDQVGTITLDVLYNDTAGAITIMRDGGGLSLILDMSISSPQGIHSQYFIDTYSRN